MTSEVVRSGRRLLFVRFVTIYLLLNAIPYALFIVPFGRTIRQAFIDLLFPVVRRFGDMALGLEVVPPPHGTGSGDTSFDWAYLALSLAAAALATGLWTLIRGSHGPARGLGLWLRVAIRYALAANMLAYGIVKVVGYQFPSPEPERLIQPYGDSSPMALLWTFMGHSLAYSIFAGLVEIGGGVLLLFRRTTTLGALILVGALSNVVILNLAYDVPVKLFSVQLLIGSVFLIWPDRHRLIGLFLLNRTAGPGDLTTPPGLARLGRMRSVLKGALIAMLLAPTAWQQLDYLRDRAAPEPELFGVYEVRDVEGARPSHEEARRVTFDRQQMMTLWAAPYVRLASYRVTAVGGAVTSAGIQDPSSTTLFYTRPEPGLVEVTGQLDGRSVRLLLEKTDELPLVNSGFHWVAELPRNH